ncbi:vacuolar import and degradation protein-domain-containing protein [Pisolithus thermaeus]|nr:vacuolar import and degradation protein-domain-containing protein [Pisolithus thermaeus]
MPVNHLHPVLVEQSLQSDTQATKYCSHCSSPLNADAVFILDDHDPNLVCSTCRARTLPARSQDPADIYVDRTSPIVRRDGLPNIDPNPDRHPTTLFEDDIQLSSSLSSAIDPSISIPVYPICQPATISLPSVASRRPQRLSIPPTFNAIGRPSPVSAQSYYTQESLPDPSVDITRLRVRSQTYHCLYPGATFTGTQKSGRNSYDVTVTIVDVDLSSSFLCGYLCIRGLTEDWPELTTYFDAEIVGNRHGFLTQKWGASEQDDMVHWQRFPAFRHVRNELKRPRLTMPDRDRGAIFMRWKERFLIPDHKVHDINGASFAGFYYVCVEFNPQSSASTLRPTVVHEDGETTMSTSPPPGRRRRDSSVRRAGRGSSIGPRCPPSAATMSGFYYHQKSEPYQQLSLSHVAETFSSTFEFR